MLFKQSWEIRSLEGLIAWLETMPADGTYNWHDCNGECMYGQYMAAHGIPWVLASGYSDFLSAAYTVAYIRPWTYGAALARARKALT